LRAKVAPPRTLCYNARAVGEPSDERFSASGVTLSLPCPYLVIEAVAQVQIRDYWTILSKRWWLVVLVAAVATAASIGFAKVQQPVYRATVVLTVSPSRYDYGLTMVIESLLRQYSRQLQTEKLAQQVSDRLDLQLSPQSLLGKLKVSSVSEDYLLELQVDDIEANRARDIAYVWADEFLKQQQIRMSTVAPTDRILVEMLDEPAPAELYFPKTRQIAMAAGALGLVAGLLLAFVLEYLDDSLKAVEDVERYISLPVLGTIPTANAASTTGATQSRRRRLWLLPG
jgi:capsular polysaccharide biosynthesis protein